MNINNDIRNIQDLSSKVIIFAIHKEYEMAHSALDGIEANCLLAHKHIDRLQHKAALAANPPGENVK